MTTIASSEVPNTPPTTAICTQCGCESTLYKLFQTTFKGTFCPACAAKRAMRHNRNLYLLINLVALFSIAYSWLFFGTIQGVGYILLISEIALLISTAMHELFHATAAWLLGGRVFGVHLGMGAPLLQRWLGDFLLVINTVPAGGLCFAAFPTRSRLPQRFALYIFAGPFFHILVILIFGLLSVAGVAIRSSTWMFIFLMTNVLSLLINLFPLTKIYTPMGIAESDGSQLWKLFTNQLKADTLHLRYHLMAANFALQRSRNDRALQEIEEGYLLYPNDESMRNFYGYMLFRSNRFDECFPIWRKLVEEEPEEIPNPLMQALHYNNYAWIMLTHKLEPNFLELAERYAKKAFAMAPWIPNTRGTFAALLAEQGEYEEAIDYALEAAEQMKESHLPVALEGAASNLATAALAFHRQGKSEEAKNLLNEAKQLAAHEFMVQQAVKEIEQSL